MSDSDGSGDDGSAYAGDDGVGTDDASATSGGDSSYDDGGDSGGDGGGADGSMGDVVGAAAGATANGGSGGSFLGGLEQAGSGLLHTAEDLGAAARDVGATIYHGAAATADAFIDDRQATEQQQDAREQARSDVSDDLDRAGRDFGL